MAKRPKPRRSGAPAELPLAAEWPADRVARAAVAALVPYARNARTHSEEQVRQIAASIQEWGWTIPVLVDEEGGIIAGHGRVLAAQLLGIAEVPVMIATGWTEAQKRAYVIADNKIAANAGWDDARLALEIGDLKGLGFDLARIGFADFEVAQLLAPGSAGLTDPDAVPEPPTIPVSRLGDTWLLGSHRVRCGDSTKREDVAALLLDAKPHLMVTDPPYGVDYDPDWRNKAERADGTPIGASAIGRVENDDRADWREAWSLFPGDVAYLWHAAAAAAIAAASILSVGFEIRSQIIWAKSNFAIGRGHYHFQHEPCWYAVRKGKTGHWSGDRKQSTLWEIPKPAHSETGHSTQKPVECMRRPVVNNSRPGELVYDPFLGSGTTVIAAEMEGRACLGMELSPAYVDVAVARWQDFTGKIAILEQTKETFSEVSSSRAPETMAAE